MFSVKRDFIHFENRLVEVKKVLPGSRIKNVNAIKDLYSCDTVLKKGDYMYFCVSIEEAKVISD